MNQDSGAANPNKDSAWLRAAAATVAEPGSGEMILGEMGEKARVVFVGEPFPYDAIWSEDDGWVPYNRKDQSHNGVTPACRVRMNVWCAERHAMYWYEMSAATFRVLLKHRERAPIEDRVFQIERMDSDDACPIYRIDESGVYLVPANVVRWDLGSCGHLAERATERQKELEAMADAHPGGLPAQRDAVTPAAAENLTRAYLDAVERAERESGARRDAENARQWEVNALLAAVESALRLVAEDPDAARVLDAALTGFARGARRDDDRRR